MNTRSARRTILFVTPYLWDAPKLSFHRLARELSTWANVAFVESGVSVASPLRDRGRARSLLHRSRELSDSFVLVTPLALPPQGRRATSGVNSGLLVRATRAELRRRGWGAPDVVFTNLPQSWRLRRTFPEAVFVVHASDAPLKESATTKRAADYLWEYERMWGEADAAVAVSPPLLDLCRDERGVPATLIPHGVDFEAIRSAAARGVPEDLAEIPGPRIGYIGRLGWHRVDAEIVSRAALAHPEWSFVFIGSQKATVDRWDAPPDKAATPVADLSNVYLLGERKAGDLGAYMQGLDAGWVPYIWTPFNRVSNPLKVLEYLAGGIPVVSSGFDALGPIAPYVSLVDEGGDFVAPLERAVRGFSGTCPGIDEDDPTAPARARSERIAFASDQDWRNRGRDLRDFFEELLASSRATP